MTLYNHKGKPIDLTFTSLLFRSFNPPTRRGAKALPKKAPPDPPKPPEEPPKPPEEPPKPANEPPGPPPPPPPAGEKPAAPEPLAWTATEDLVLRTLKAQNKSWKEIEEMLPGRNKDALRLRYKELTKDEAESTKGDGATGAEDVSEKGKKGGKPKGILKEGASPKPGDVVVVAPPKPPSIIETGDGTTLSGMEVEYLLKLDKQYEDKKYNALASKIFDRTGKRIDPQLLKTKLGGT